MLGFMMGVLGMSAVLLIIIVCTLLTLFICDEFEKDFRIIYVFVFVLFIFSGGLIGIFAF